MAAAAESVVQRADRLPRQGLWGASGARKSSVL